ncbi:winged helix-turn-helix domain-containing protein [Haloplanus natans]|uniref:winged helix-turn-helix domain-containing protein n=1 Tax=Haloplanus natans TaxID=376171 RepID=UPI000677D05A|nr:winged helix-turn-helix domain-containing protein [Haloplanus natans]
MGDPKLSKRLFRQFLVALETMKPEQWDRSDFEAVSGLFQGLAHEARLALLLGIYHGKSLNEIAEFLEITRGGMQDHLEKLIDCELLYRPEETGKTYGLTPFGLFFVEFLLQNEETLVEALGELRLEEKRVELAVEEVRNEAEEQDISLSEKEWQRKVHSRKWEQAWDDVKDSLGVGE